VEFEPIQARVQMDLCIFNVVRQWAKESNTVVINVENVVNMGASKKSFCCLSNEEH
jgi:hypothetical protein